MKHAGLHVVALAVLLAAGVAAAAQESPRGDLPALPAPLLGAPAEQDFALAVRLDPASQAPGHPVVAVAEFDCPEHWYIYADSISLELADPDGAPLRAGRLSLPTPKSKYDQFLEQEVSYFDGKFGITLPLDLREDAPAGEHTVQLQVGYQGCKPDLCFLPQKRSFELRLTVLPTGAQPVPIPGLGPLATEPTTAPEEPAGRNLLLSVIVAFALGLGLSLTPCIYPMIPITISVIGATATERKLSALVRSLTYVGGISVTYALLGAIAASTGRALGTVLQHPAVYLVLALMLVVLAAAMLDLFTIQVAASWTARLQEKLRGRAGLMGIFALGLLSGVAVTACIAPVLVAELGYVMKEAKPVTGFLVLFALAWGMGTPLVVLGTFSGLLRHLPQSGAWQQTVKHIFGLGLLGAAVYFVGRSRVMPDVWYQMFVGGVLLVSSVFVGAFDSLEASSDSFGRARKSLGLLLLAGAIVFFVRPLLVERTAAGPPAEAIPWVTSLEQARAEGTSQHKPVMLYFWQERCPACEKLKARTFPDPRVVAESKKRFISAKVDGTHWDLAEQKRMRDVYDIWGFPTIAFVSSEGEVLKESTQVGYKTPEQLLQAMQSVR